ncbi:DUF1549 domain-containing protein [Segetibacter aerophilus]|uniref:Cytochrome c domain-containing protein n=1 Tax=Segetibacter aerophilus TaxID=670293 RepID=A0A512B911_9BACT|nr:DUF1549 domain-containing protein [Segetibacter aerophilus]GEO08442.1 hypothetical protein SAE01_09380 [Segetibacter aerophilus]
MKKQFKKVASKKRLLVVALVIVLVFVLNPFFILNSYAGDAPLAASGEAPLSTASNSFWLWNFLARLHPLTVHFPVSLLLFAAILELFTLKNFHSKLRPGINILLAAGVATATVSIIFGLLLGRGGDYNEDTLSLHQWTGISTATLGAVALFLLFKISRNNELKLIKPYRAILIVSAIGVCVAGHLGAALTHGSDYLSSTLPWSKDYEATPVKNVDFASYKNDTVKLSKQEEQELNMQVKTILAHNCYKCHGPEKIKGELRLDSKKMIFKGGEDGPVIVAGDPLKSDLFRRISLPANHKDVMPSKGKKLSEGDIATIKFWIQKGAPYSEGKNEETNYRVAKLEPRNPSLPQASTDLQNPIDLWVNEYFKKNKISWTAVVDDRTYLKRIYLDILGLLPSPEDLNNFARDPRPDKRSVWVRQLLNRNDDYAMNWLTFWNDALRNDYTGTGYITGGRFDISNWLYNSLKTNKSYNQFVKELVSPGKDSRGFIAGIKWRGVINASQRTEMQAAQNVSQVFFGLNLKCASCHNSFISDWKLDDAYGFANIFADSSLEINRCDKPSGKFTSARLLWKELGTINSTAAAAIKQQQLAELMTKPADGRLYRTLVNRIWAQMMGRGIVEPVDLMDNEPWSQDLLDWLAFNFEQRGADIKELIFLIATSKTYQLPSVGFKEPNQLFAKDYKFKGMLKRRLSAEQFADAVSSIVAPMYPDSLVKFVPFIETPAEKSVEAKPVEKKAAPTLTPAQKAAADKIAAEKRKAAKKLAEERAEAGRLVAYKLFTNKSILLYPRASLVINNKFLTALGRPNRETVSTSRESQANLLQALELTNGDRFNATLKTGAENWKRKYGNGDVLIKEMYRKTLGREPQQKEFAVAKKMLGPTPGTESIQDLFWSILLLPEFQIIY